jgi:UvrD-like helicase C-terminal domain/UvrD/REP helicase N-terminal domain
MLATLECDPTPETLGTLCDERGLHLKDGAVALYSQVRGRSLANMAVLSALLTHGQLLSQRQAAAAVVDFDDLVRLAPAHLPAGHFRVLLVDEAQDLSRAARRLAAHLGQHVVLVGDENQGLNVWAGAEPGGFGRCADGLGAARGTLEVTLRCPASHVRLARRLDDTIRPREGAPDGEVRRVDNRAVPALIRDGDLVLARHNQPLRALAYTLLARGQAVSVAGWDVRDALLAVLVQALGEGARTDAVGRATLLTALDGLLATSRPGGRAAADAWTLTQAGAGLLRALAGRLDWSGGQVHGTGALLGLLPVSATPARLSSVHRAKGAEADRVVLYRAGELDEAGEEAAVLYVALTRARQTLFIGLDAGESPVWLMGAGVE